MNKKIAMILSVPDIRKDARVMKEAKALFEAGYKITVCAWDRECQFPEEESFDSFSVKYFKVKSSYGKGLLQIPALLKFYSQVFSYIKNNDFSIIHCHDLETLPLGARIKRKKKVKLIFDAHEPEYFSDARRFRKLMIYLGKKLESIFLRAADYVIVTNEYQVNKYKKLKAKNVQLVANYPEKSLISMQRNIPKSDDFFTIGRIGALYHDMGIEELIDAYSLLHKQNKRLRLLIAGRTTKQYRKIINKKIEKANGLIRFIDSYNVSEVSRLYNMINLEILPQKKTNWFKNITPTKFFESLACGVPVITTDIGGIGDIVRQNKCGFVLQNSNAKEIAAKISEALSDRDALLKMSNNAIQAVKTKYNWDVSKKELSNIYDKLQVEYYAD